MANVKAKTAAPTPPPAGIKKSTAREYFESLCVAVILALFVRTFVVQAFKIPTGSMENNLLIGDHLLVNKMVFAPTLTRVRAGDPADRPDPARRHHRVQVSGGTRARLHQAGDRPPGRDPGAEEQDGVHQRQGPRGAVRALPVSRCGTRQRRLHRPRRPPEVRAGDRACRPLLHDGRQPRQLAGQPLLGVHAAELREGQGAVRLFLVRRRERAASSTASAGVGSSIRFTSHEDTSSSCSWPR